VRPAGECSRTGVALVMVILILAGLLAIAVPLVYICHSNETSAARTLDQQIARRYALSALELAKGQLRRGTYENEFRAAYPPPTAFPTPTPANVANLAPYNTPDFDAGPELIVPQAELDKAILRALPNGDTVSVSVEVEDEQSKLNLNSITPRLLRGLYMAVFRIDAKGLSADDRAALKARFEHLIDPIAMLRFSSGSYTPLRSVEQIRNFSTTDNGTTYQLSETEYEAMRPFLTVHSWRPSESGFDKSPYTGTLFGGQVQSVHPTVNQFDCPFRIDYYDAEKRVMKTYFAVSIVVTENNQPRTIIPVPSASPVGAYFYTFEPEVFHPVNVNNADRTVLLAFCLAPIEIDNPAYGLSEAIAYAKGIRADGKVKSIAQEGGGYIIELSDDSDDFAGKIPSLVSCGRSYFNVSPLDRAHLKSADDLSGLAASEHSPPDISTVVVKPGDLRNSMQSEESPISSYLAAVSRSLLSSTSYDVYSVRSECSLRSSADLERARWHVTECVSVGGPRSEDSTPLALDNACDWIEATPSGRISALLCPQKRRFWRSWMLDKALGASGLLETVPPSLWATPIVSGSDAFAGFYGTDCAVKLYSDSSSPNDAQNRMHIAGWDAASLGYHSESSYGSKALGYVQPSSRISFFSERSDRTIHACDIGTPLPRQQGMQPIRLNLAVGGWFKALGWEPSADTNMHRLFSILPKTAGVSGSTQLFIKDGLLSLRVEDDNGVAGSFSYRLTAQTFPQNAWMHIICHIGGNQQGQCSIFVDHRPVPIEYSTSASRSDGYCVLLKGIWPCTVPIISQDIDGDPSTLDVNSTEGYADSGYFRVEDEVVFYGAKTATSFLSLRRSVGGTQTSSLAVGTRILPASAIDQSFANWSASGPTAGDEVTLVAYEMEPDNGYRASSRDPQKMTLDIGTVYDPHTANVLCAPKNVSFSTGLPLAAHVFGFCGTSGTMTTGDRGTGDIDVFFFSAPGQSDGFVGDAGFQFLARPRNPVFRIRSDMQASGSDSAWDFYASANNMMGSGSGSLFQIDDEVIGAICTGSYPGTLQRGILGTAAAKHGGGTWAVPLDYYDARPLPADLDATTAAFSISDSRDSLFSGNFWRIDDEIAYFYVDSASQNHDVMRVLRGSFGSVPSVHQAGSLAVAFPHLACPNYDFGGADGLQRSFLEFSRHRPGMRISGLTWKDLAPDPFVQLHFWADVADDHDFVREPVSPNVFHFTSKSKDFSISRNGEPVLTDNVTIRVMHEYLRGAWLPNDPTRHSWKVLPQIDKIELWIQEPDVVFEHREHP